MCGIMARLKFISWIKSNQKNSLPSEKVGIRVCNLFFISKLLPSIPKQQLHAKLKQKLKLHHPIMNHMIQKEGHQEVSFVIKKKRY
jgi:hypothetical protein